MGLTVAPGTPGAEIHSQHVGYFIFLKRGCSFCHRASLKPAGVSVWEELRPGGGAEWAKRPGTAWRGRNPQVDFKTKPLNPAADKTSFGLVKTGKI